MKKILFANNILSGGGVEKVMYDVVSYLDKSKYEVTIFTDYKDKNFKKIYPYNVNYIYYYPFNVRNKNSLILRIIRKLFRVIKGHYFFRKFDTVVAMKEGNTAIFVSKFKYAQRKVGWIHTDYEAMYWTKMHYKSSNDEFECMKKFDEIICVSNTVKENLIKVIGDPQNLTVCYNPINIEEVRTKSRKNCEIKRNEQRIIFISVGRLSPEKGYDKLFQSLSHINDTIDYELWIIGDGSPTYKTKLERILDQTALQKRIKLFGNQDNPFPYVIQADWFICSSVTESFGLAIQEALILGIPVITTNCRGACELLDDKYSIVVDNTDMIQSTIIDIINNPEKTFTLELV